MIFVVIGVEKMDNGEEVSIKPKLADRLDDFSNQQDPDGSDNADSNPANEINDARIDASQEMEDEALSDKTVHSKAHSEDKLSDSASEKCSPSGTTHVVMERENSVKDDLNTSGKNEVISLNDTSVDDVHPEDAPDCPENCTLAPETAPSDLNLTEDMAEPDSEQKSNLPTAVNGDSSENERNHVVDNMVSSEEVDMNNNIHEVQKAFPSGGLSEENITAQSNKNADISDSVLTSADESSMQISSVFNSKIVCQERNLKLGTEVASKNMTSGENGINASNDSSETGQE